MQPEKKFLRSEDYDNILKLVKCDIENPFGLITDIYQQHKERNPKFIELLLKATDRAKFPIIQEWNNFLLLNPTFEWKEFLFHSPDFKFYETLKTFLSELDNQEQAKEQPEPTNAKQPKEQPQTLKPVAGKSQLNREQTALLFWYLRERSIIIQPDNTTLATAINLLTGHKDKQMKDILKVSGTPVYNIGKRGQRVDRNDFKTIISELQILIDQIKKDYKINSDNGELK